jgi:ribosomal protein L3 glutamine methyltransferase
MRTVRDLWRYACTRFSAAGLHHGHGVDDPRDEAAWLILWSLHLPPDSLEPWLDARLTPGEVEVIVELVERRCADRIPLPYLTGEAWLRGVRFRSDPRALVSRSLIPEAIEESLPAWLDVAGRPADWPRSILDLCTGGGSIAILAAMAFPDARVEATDISQDALDLAAQNVADHGLAERIRLHRGDLFEPLGRRRFDLVLCNPPYVNAESMATLPAEFLAEPQLALAGGRDGMDVIRRILAEAPAHMTTDGLLVLEIGHEAPHFEAAFPRLEFGWLPVAAGEHMVVVASRQQLEAAR